MYPRCEHSLSCRLSQPVNAEVAEQALAKGDHCVLFEETKILSSVSAYFRRLHLDAAVAVKWLALYCIDVYKRQRIHCEQAP